ncbi:hypothetical protein Kisp02_36540 [Kineosporia sp. NBRC 101731]|nr:hypothetical protein Kisp02_36540 [Kineosporia sp. NBRC 101731]
MVPDVITIRSAIGSLSLSACSLLEAEQARGSTRSTARTSARACRIVPPCLIPAAWIHLAIRPKHAARRTGTDPVRYNMGVRAGDVLSFRSLAVSRAVGTTRTPGLRSHRRKRVP